MKTLRGTFRLARKNRGQASIMIGMMMMTFMLFFTFVVNTGMLVNAKINLQNAADLAAYAGAATQARQLNQISYLNYEMRRAYKKFLFRYYVMGNVAQDSFQAQGSGNNAHVWSPDNDVNYGVPTVCLTFNSTDNFCHVAQLNHIPVPASNPTDMINQTLISQLQALEQLRENNCGDIGQNNTQVLWLWLYNTDPTLQNLISQQTNQNTQGMLQVTQAVSTGLGLIPRELILSQRIKTVQSYVNEDAQQNVTLDTVNSMQQGPDPSSNERTIQAFLSAYYTLSASIYANDPPLVMDEMIPGPSNGGTLLNLKNITANFDTYAVAYIKSPPQGYPGPNGVTVYDCKATLVPIPVSNLMVGVSKDPTALTYYAVRLKATAKIMFSPFGDMDLKAYAAARPFGSRIGPAIDGSQFVRQAQPAGLDLLVSTQLAGAVPNLPITLGDSSAQGWNTNAALAAYYAALGVGGPKAVINQSNAISGYQVAMAPNPYEGNLYNIIDDQVQDPFIKNFDQNRQAKFWAPVFSAAAATNIQSSLTDALNEIYQGPANVGQITGSSGAAIDPNLVAGLKQGLTTYLGLLANEQGENNEGMNIAVISDPFNTTSGPIQGSPVVLLDSSNPKNFRTSWVTTNATSGQDYNSMGRVGYSVKFVSFDSLSSGQGTSDGSTHWKNFYMDSEAQGDGVGQMQH